MAVTHRYAFTLLSKKHLDAVYSTAGNDKEKDDAKRTQQLGDFLATENILSWDDPKLDAYAGILYARLTFNDPDCAFDANTVSMLSFNEYGDETGDTGTALELFKHNGAKFKFVPVAKTVVQPG